jgi:hypothetical protein
MKLLLAVVIGLAVVYVLAHLIVLVRIVWRGEFPPPKFPRPRRHK